MHIPTHTKQHRHRRLSVSLTLEISSRPKNLLINGKIHIKALKSNGHKLFVANIIINQIIYSKSVRICGYSNNIIDTSKTHPSTAKVSIKRLNLHCITYLINILPSSMRIYKVQASDTEQTKTSYRVKRKMR